MMDGPKMAAEQRDRASPDLGLGRTDSGWSQDGSAGDEHMETGRSVQPALRRPCHPFDLLA